MTHFKLTIPTNMVHQVRNFGETLYVEFRDDRKAHISLDHADQATDMLIVEMFYSKKNLRRVGKRIEELLKRELLFDRTTVELINTKDS